MRILNGIYEIIMGRSKEPQTVDTVKVQHNGINKKSDQQIYKKEPEQEKTNKKQKEEIAQGLYVYTNSNGKELEYKPVENKIEIKNEAKGVIETVFPQVQVEPQPQILPEIKREEIKTEEKLKDEPERVFVENKEPINTEK